VSEQPSTGNLRVALSGFPDGYALPSRPASAPSVVLDAYRQAQFLLGGDLEVFDQAMNLQVRIVAGNAKLRTTAGAALFSLWSRVFSYFSDCCHLMCLGSYVSCVPLLRTACDCIAAQRALIAEGFVQYEAWLADAIRQDREHAALSFDLGRFRSGSILAEDARLGVMYRLLTDLSMPHFGTTALQTAPDSNLQKLSIAFADSAFHLGWAELIAGWLLTLAGAQLDTVASSGVFTIDDEAGSARERLGREIAARVEDRRRCYVEETDGQFVIHNFRRTAAGAPKRVTLS